MSDTKTFVSYMQNYSTNQLRKMASKKLNTVNKRISKIEEKGYNAHSVEKFRKTFEEIRLTENQNPNDYSINDMDKSQLVATIMNAEKFMQDKFNSATAITRAVREYKKTLSGSGIKPSERKLVDLFERMENLKDNLNDFTNAFGSQVLKEIYDIERERKTKGEVVNAKIQNLWLQSGNDLTLEDIYDEFGIDY